MVFSESAVNVLLARRDEFLGFLARRVPDRALAEDLLQSALATAVTQVQTVEDPEKLVPWFYRVLRNAVIDEARRRGTQERAAEAYALEPAEAAPNLNTCPCVMHAKARLKPSYVAALDGVVVGEQSLARFAEAEGISTINAGVRAHRAREALREEVERTCGTCAQGGGCFDCRCEH
jgi:RNA polymerase sigma factor (sigma-70 family)